MVVGGQTIRTLRDILPDPPGLKLLFVGKTPSPTSVLEGHYFQGRQGKLFWGKLRQYRILLPTTTYEDDSLLNNGFGITDVVKVPHVYRQEPSRDEYIKGINRVFSLLKAHNPRVVVFVYKKVLDQVLRHKFCLRLKANYGFNHDLRARFGAHVFVFPMPGTRCNRGQTERAMHELALWVAGCAWERALPLWVTRSEAEHFGVS